MCRVGSLGWALGLRKKKETVSILSLCPHRTKESMKLRGTDTPESAQPVRGRAGISAQACVTPGPCFHLPSAQPSLRVVGEERMCVTPLQEFLCGSYPPDLIVSLLRIGTLLLTSVSPKKQRKQWHPPPVPLPGEPHGRRSLVGCSPWGRKELDTTERHHFPFSLSCIGEGNGNPLQCSCLESPRDGGAWWAAVYGVPQGRTRLKRLSSSSSSQEGPRCPAQSGCSVNTQ